MLTSMSMGEAFKRHVPAWIFAALIIALIFVVIGNNPANDYQEQSTNGQIPAATEPPGVELVRIVDGLIQPTDIVSTGNEGDNRLFIVEQIGKIRLIENGQLASKTVLDISDKVINEGEQGLLGLAFHPDLEQNPYIYVNYVRLTELGPQTVIARYDLNKDQTEADVATEKIVMTISQPYSNHKGGDLVFGPDGYLYLAVGDGGAGGDPENRAQNPKTLLGKILRIDVNSNSNYEIPKDNPFSAKDGYLPEIWSLGWRNPWRISFDRETKAMWAGDVGQNSHEEINYEPEGDSGRNYGWRCFEAGEEYEISGCGDRSKYTFPVAQYDHEPKDCSGSVTGGYVYRGQDYPALTGWYIFADYCTGRFYLLHSDRRAEEPEVVLKTKLGISTFGEDTHGEIYAADIKDGVIYRLQTTQP